MKPKALPDIGMVREFLSYDPRTGELVWIKKPARGTNVGSTAGRVDATGYVVIGFCKSTYKAHRLAWFLMTEDEPETIDHINGIKSDNRFVNLRPATPSQNLANREVSGAHFSKKRGKWQSAIKVGYKSIWLGYFATEAEARAAYADAAKRFYGEFARAA